jgi:hypothetical protein
MKLMGPSTCLRLAKVNGARAGLVSGILLAFGSGMARCEPADPSGSGVTLHCDAHGDAALCHAIDRALDRVPDADALGVAFRLTARSNHGLGGYLEWRTSAGAVMRGPEVRIAVMDAPLTPARYDRFAQDLLRATPALDATLD